MEKYFFRDGFENYLKDSVDNFRMYPSKKVWNSIYNNMHPGRRWPSLTVILLLIFSLVYIGITHNHRFTAKNSSATTPVLNKDISGISPLLASTLAQNPKISKNLPAKKINHDNNTVVNISGNINTLSPKRNVHKNINQNKKLIAGSTSNYIVQNWGRNNTPGLPAQQNTATNIWHNPTFKITASEADQTILFSLTPSFLQQENLRTSIVSNFNIKKRMLPASSIFYNQDKAEREWIEDYAFHNKPRMKKWKNNVDYSAYVTPSMGYRNIKTNIKFDAASRTATLSPLSNTYFHNPEVDQLPAFNFEAGAVARYHYSQSLLLKFGLQFNYQNYLVMATKLNHSTATSLLMNDQNSGFPYLVPKSSNLSNISGLAATSMNNNSYQVSVPIGVDFKLAGNDKIQWYAGASLQPGIVFGGQSLLISSDQKNYISDNSLRRKFNLNTGVESYLTYKTSGGLSLLAGPQLRYQVFSSYNNQYSYKETMYNIGMKIGVIKKF